MSVNTEGSGILEQSAHFREWGNEMGMSWVHYDWQCGSETVAGCGETNAPFPLAL